MLQFVFPMLQTCVFYVRVEEEENIITKRIKELAIKKKSKTFFVVFHARKNNKKILKEIRSIYKILYCEMASVFKNQNIKQVEEFSIILLQQQSKEYGMAQGCKAIFR